MWDSGGLHALPPLAPPTDASASSASPGLPTPAARDHKGGMDPARRRRDGRPRRASDADLPSALVLLRTPTAQLADNGGSQHPDKRKAGGHGPTLADEVEWLLGPDALLPTPLGSDGNNGSPRQRGSKGEMGLPGLAPLLLPTPEASDATGGRRAAELGGTRPSGSKRAITLATALAFRSIGGVTALPSAGGSALPAGQRHAQLSLPGLESG